MGVTKVSVLGDTNLVGQLLKMFSVTQRGAPKNCCLVFILEAFA